MCHLDGDEICLVKLFSEGGGAQHQLESRMLEISDRDITIVRGGQGMWGDFLMPCVILFTLTPTCDVRHWVEAVIQHSYSGQCIITVVALRTSKVCRVNDSVNVDPFQRT